MELYLIGAISSSTLLVNGANAPTAAMHARKHNIPAGIHINLTEGVPICPATTVSSLVNDDGVFRGKFGFFEALEQGRIQLNEVFVHYYFMIQ